MWVTLEMKLKIFLQAWHWSAVVVPVKSVTCYFDTLSVSSMKCHLPAVTKKRTHKTKSNFILVTGKDVGSSARCDELWEREERRKIMSNTESRWASFICKQKCCARELRTIVKGPNHSLRHSNGRLHASYRPPTRLTLLSPEHKQIHFGEKKKLPNIFNKKNLPFEALKSGWFE